MSSPRISVVAPVLNEIQFIGYSIMAAEPWTHEFIYALDEKSDDGTRELLEHIKAKYLHERLVILDTPNFHPSEMEKYNGAFNDCIKASTGEACFFLHPDMIVTQGATLEEGPLAWTTHVTSFAGDMQTVITKGRCDQWKNIHVKQFGLKYFGGYGSQNEDFYHHEITQNSHKHYGTDFASYPFEVAQSGIKVNHYCELKPYKRRLEKMKLCIKTLNPNISDIGLKDISAQHPRVTLEPTSTHFGVFEFSRTDLLIPDVFTKYKDEFESFKKELIHHG